MKKLVEKFKAKSALQKVGLIAVMIGALMLSAVSSFTTTTVIKNVATIGSDSFNEFTTNRTIEKIRKEYRTEYNHPKLFVILDRFELDMDSPFEQAVRTSFGESYLLTVKEFGGMNDNTRVIAVDRDMYDKFEDYSSILLYDGEKAMLYNEEYIPRLFKNTNIEPRVNHTD